MKKNINKYVIGILSIVVVVLIFVLIFTFINSNKKTMNNTADLQQKVSTEIEYLDFNTINIMNKLNNITILKYKVYTKDINTEQNKEDVSSKAQYLESQSNNGSSSSNQESNSNKNNNGNSQTGSSSSQSSGQDNSSSSSQGSEGNSSQSNSSNQNNSSNTQSGTSSNLTTSKLVPNVSSWNVSLTDNDWSDITYSIENLYSGWPVIYLDLQKLDVPNDKITQFGTSLNGAIQSINSKDKNSALINLNNMYGLLCIYEEYVTSDQYQLGLLNTKAYILNSYVLSQTQNWKDMTVSIANAKTNFDSVINSVDDNDTRKTNLEKMSIILNELQSSVALNDINIYYINYK